jgi:hypothetical protein
MLKKSNVVSSSSTVQAQKRDFSSSTSGRRQTGPKQPEIYHADTLSIVSDDDLNSIYNHLEHDRNLALAVNGDARPWEDEISYVQREMQMRRIRHDAHVEFVRQTERENARIEASLPYADLDNTRFLRLVGEIQ